MKLTKSRLKQIIKEEISLFLERGFGEGESADPQGFSMKRDTYLEEEAVSTSQQQFMAMVRKCQKDGDCPNEKIKKAAQSMSEKETLKFASTKHEGLPKKVAQNS